MNEAQERIIKAYEEGERKIPDINDRYDSLKDKHLHIKFLNLKQEEEIRDLKRREVQLLEEIELLKIKVARLELGKAYNMPPKIKWMNGDEKW